MEQLYVTWKQKMKKKNFPFWERFNQSLSKYIPADNKIRKNKIPKTSC